jgi:UDP-2,3-diacylglucosamine pyrophosphatase LpxH
MSKYIILNDFHLGSEVCQRNKIIEVLKSIKTEVLILNGDLIDINHTKRLKKKDIEILSLLRKASKNTKVIYTLGNHDSEIAPTISDLLGFECLKHYDFELAGKLFHVTHGDYFDTFISKFWLLTEIATGLYYWIQRLDTKKQTISRSLKKNSKSFINCCNNMRKRAELFADIHSYDYVICGHSHQPFSDNNSKYINTGCFTESECSYLTISHDGKIELKFI